ncbi:MFS transporter [Ursidibacter arcticus]|uniref:peptide MFS transporter n=1 Tax=Ursidibacter arcticus TaxID=1524965 RepID=UPI0012F800A1|nr:oligopeptide:H+ symporter [Ursidibacter arcticus]KAE9533636.1 MFS transporter [Ursidibacter arcticus]
MQSKTSEKTFFGHPRQLAKLFQIELWERFSFIGMQSILLLYLYYKVSDGGLGIDSTIAGGIVGGYGGTIFLATILGAWISDRIWGPEKTLFMSGFIVMFGNLAIALIPGISGLFTGLALIALGTGGIKASATTMVGALYEREDLRILRDSGFSIFYVSINLGAFFGPLVSGLLQESFGFRYAFVAAAVGMAFGIWQYSRGRKSLPDIPVPNPLPSSQVKYAIIIGILGLIALFTAITLKGLTLDNFPTVLLITIVITIATYFTKLLTNPDLEREKKNYILAYIPMFCVISIFWAMWMQVFTVVTIYFDQTIDRNLGSFTIPVAWMTSLQGLWVVLFSGILASIWMKLGKLQPKTPIKFAFSVIIVGSGYLCFTPYFESNTVMPLALFALALLVITIGELFLSPISLSFATKIAPATFKTQMVALNFLALGLGLTLGGTIYKHFYVENNPGSFFWLLFMIGLITGSILLLLSPVLNRVFKNID